MEQDIFQRVISDEAVTECFEAARCLESPSYVRSSGFGFVPGRLSLAIDCGGTNTRCILHEVRHDGTERIEHIAAGPNESFEGARAGLDRFASAIYTMTRTRLSERRLDGITVVWSNDIECRPEECGITGIVKNKENGISYRKDEPYTRGLRDGDDIGRIFRAACGGAPSFVVLNDTIAVALSMEGASGGVVLSTGGNATSVRDGYFQNIEAGANVRLPPSCMTKIEESRYRSGLTLEEACAGRWLPDLYILNNPSFNRPKHFSSKEFAKLVPPSGDAGSTDGTAAYFIADRAAKLCGVLGAISLRPFMEGKWEGRRLVNLDSRIAENIPWFLSSANRMLQTLVGPGHSASFRMIDGSDGASTLRGAVRALHGFWNGTNAL